MADTDLPPPPPAEAHPDDRAAAAGTNEELEKEISERLSRMHAGLELARRQQVEGRKLLEEAELVVRTVQDPPKVKGKKPFREISGNVAGTSRRRTSSCRRGDPSLPPPRGKRAGAKGARPGHPPPALEDVDALLKLARVNQEEGMWAEAERLLLEALNIRRQVLGTDHKLVTASLTGLAELAEASGSWTAGEMYFREAYQNSLRLKGKASNVVHLRHGLGRCLLSQARFQEAETLFRSVLADLAGAVRADSAKLCRTRHLLSVALTKQGFSQEASGLVRLNAAFGFVPAKDDDCLPSPVSLYSGKV